MYIAYCSWKKAGFWFTLEHTVGLQASVAHKSAQIYIGPYAKGEWVWLKVNRVAVCNNCIPRAIKRKGLLLSIVRCTEIQVLASVQPKHLMVVSASSPTHNMVS